MPRVSPPERLAEVAQAATRVFGRLGYRRAHMADVAAEARLSSGSIYTYVESKEALFYLVFADAFGLFTEGLPPLPLATPDFQQTMALIAQGLRKQAATPILQGALSREDPGEVGDELSAIVEERYAMLERIWPILAVIERCAVDLPDLEEFYFQRGRHRHIGQLTRYLERRGASGHIRVLADVAVAARLVTETITWFAWHRWEDPYAIAYDDERTRRTVVEFITSALVVAVQ